MEIEQLYWTVVVAIITAIWTLAIFIRDRNSTAVQMSNTLTNRLLEIDRFLMENPDIQQYMSSTAINEEEYFFGPEVLKDLMFYKAKSLAYFHINLFDELLSLTRRSKEGLRILMPPSVTELSDWETYIRRKFSHPLYRSILNREGEVFGASLREFWASAKNVQNKDAGNQHVW